MSTCYISCPRANDAHAVYGIKNENEMFHCIYM